MIRIADHIETAEPVEGGNHFYKAFRNDKQVSAIQVFPFQLTAAQYPFFKEQVRLLTEAINEYHAAIPRIRSWGFTKTGNLPFIEMAWTEGYELTKLHQQRPVTVDEISTIAEQISRVLTYCHHLGLVHGDIGSKHILWDKKKEMYVLTGFRFGLQPANVIIPKERTSARSNSFPEPVAPSQQKDIYDLGVVLFQLLRDHLLVNTKLKMADADERSLAEEKLKDGTQLPAWLATCIARALHTTNEENFKSASDMYHYIFLYHKTPISEKKWYRSKPQQPLTTQGQPQLKGKSLYPKKISSLMASGIHRGKKEMRFVFDSRIAVGLIIAGLLTGFSIIAQNGVKKEPKDVSLVHNDTNLNSRQPDSTAYITKENSAGIDLQAVRQEKKEAKKSEAVTTPKKENVQKFPIAKPTIEQEVNTRSGIGAFKVRGKAYFHNQPDESTRRNAFIVHWNNAVLHPLKEVNDFVYVVFTNDEGQTSKGWLRKKDLIKL